MKKYQEFMIKPTKCIGILKNYQQKIKHEYSKANPYIKKNQNTVYILCLLLYELVVMNRGEIHLKNNSIALNLGKAEAIKATEEYHVPSKVQADTLFTFTSQLEFIIKPLKSKMLSPRYCVEDTKYLNIDQLKKLAYPMKCFCDINMHKLSEHLAWYGYYGLAFSKEWGMKNFIQPIQYINPQSYLCKDFTEAFNTALTSKDNTNVELATLKNYLLHELMYWKPYQGECKNRNTNESTIKCFTDECEWRYIPDVTIEGFDQVLSDENKLNTELFYKMNNAMDGLEKISLKFDYSDIKYIIVKTNSDFVTLSNEILKLSKPKIEEHELVSKIIIWDKSRGDF